MIELDVQAKRTRSAAPAGDSPFRVLILGDFGAETPRPVLVDRDNIEAVIDKLGVTLSLPLAGDIRFRGVADFHPDQLYARLPMFQELREAQRKLEDPNTFRQMAAEIAPPRPAAKPDVGAMLSSANLLDQIVESSGAIGTGARAAADPFQSYLQRLVAPYAVPRPDPKQKELLTQVEAAVNGQMRSLLHDPAFQSLEAAWRGVDFLVHNVDSDVQIKVYVLNVPFESLRQEMLMARDLKQTRLYELLVREPSVPGAARWSIVAGNYTFGAGPEDVELLGRISLLASAGDAPFIAAANPDTESWEKTPDYWKDLQAVPESCYVGLALPRMLMRMPYGAKTESVDTFDFEELPAVPKHGDYLWGNAVFGCLRLLMDAFAEEGWAMEPSNELFIRDLPLHVYKQDGEAVSTPVAEVLMMQDDVERLMDKGLMPLVSYKDQPLARLAGFRALSGEMLGKRW
ncbi:MAG: type VI secretion system contractile sheath large subunit [Bryobacteraceae bacterium]